MYITVPLKLQKQKIKSKQHQKLLFKEIQYKKITEQIRNQQELRKNNQKITIKNNNLKTNKQNLLKRPVTCSTLRPRTSFLKPSFKPTHRSSMTSIVQEKKSDSNQILKNNKKLQFKQKNQDSESIEFENNFFDSKNGQLKIQNNDGINTFSSKQELQKKFRQNFAKSLESCNFKQQPSLRKIKTTRKKNITFLDLKVKKIQNIIKKVGKNSQSATDFSSMVHKNQQKIIELGWKSFYNAVEYSRKNNQSNFKQEKLRLKRTAASAHLKSGASSNNIVNQIFLKENNQIPGDNKTNLNKNSYLKQSNITSKTKGSFPTEKIFKFFNFVKGAHHFDQYSKEVSLREYRKHLQKFQLLRNSQRVIKQTQDYKNITIQNFAYLNKDQLLAYVYLNENQYKLKVNNKS